MSSGEVAHNRRYPNKKPGGNVFRRIITAPQFITLYTAAQKKTRGTTLQTQRQYREYNTTVQKAVLVKMWNMEYDMFVGNTKTPEEGLFLPPHK